MKTVPISYHKQKKTTRTFFLVTLITGLASPFNIPLQRKKKKTVRERRLVAKKGFQNNLLPGSLNDNFLMKNE